MTAKRAVVTTLGPSRAKGLRGRREAAAAAPRLSTMTGKIRSMITRVSLTTRLLLLLRRAGDEISGRNECSGRMLVLPGGNKYENRTLRDLSPMGRVGSAVGLRTTY